MKLYIANGQYVGTQAEAKKIDKDFTQVEVPTDKEGLIAYLNVVVTDIHHAQVYQDQFETVVERQDPPEPGPIIRHEAPDIHELWDALPISTQLHFAALAVEEARDRLPSTRAPSRPSEKEMNAPLAEDEDLFS